MYIIYIIFAIFWNCSFFQNEGNVPEKYSPAENRNLILRIEDDDLTIPNVQIQASEHPPKLHPLELQIRLIEFSECVIRLLVQQCKNLSRKDHSPENKERSHCI